MPVDPIKTKPDEKSKLCGTKYSSKFCRIQPLKKFEGYGLLKQIISL